MSLIINLKNDKNKDIDSIYNFWRRNILLNLYIGYAGFYVTRKSFNYVLPALVTEFNFDIQEIGYIGTMFYITYGLSKFFSGLISDNVNPRYFMGFGLIATGIINICCGFATSLTMFSMLWILNAFFQGWGFPSCSQLLTTWYSRSERGFWWSIWNTAHNVGNVTLSILVGYITLHYSWREGLIFPGLIGVIIGVFLCLRLRSKPSSMGLPSVGVWRNDKLEIIQEQHEPNLNYADVIKKYVFANKYIWLLACSYLLIYIVRIGINDWGNIYLTEEYHYDLVTSNSILALFEIGGFIGSLVAGRGTDILFRGNRISMTLLFSIGIFFSVCALWLMPFSSYMLQGITFFSIGFFVCGPQMLICLAAAECSHKKSPGASTGFISLFAYVGAAISGYPLAFIVEKYHWSGFFTVMAVISTTIGLVLLPFLNKTVVHKTIEKSSEIDSML